MTTVRQLALADGDGWSRATHDPFLDGVRDGSLPRSSFARWLEQDRLFVEALLRAWARLLADAPERDLGLLADGVGALAAELMWFDDVAARHDLRSRRAEPLAETAAYAGWLQEVTRSPYAVGLAALWVVEAAYDEAWQGAAPGHPAYCEFVEHWASPEFGAFVARVEAAADRALDESPELVDDVAHAIATAVAHEAAFWAMTSDPGR